MDCEEPEGLAACRLGLRAVFRVSCVRVVAFDMVSLHMQVEDRTHFLNRLDASEDLIFGVRPTLSLGSSIVPDTHCAFLPYLLCWCIGDRCLAIGG